MTKTNLNLQEEKNTPDFDALKEETIMPLQLLQEIEPLLKEYFIGNFKIADNAVLINFINGQKFRLCIGEVTSSAV